MAAEVARTAHLELSYKGAEIAKDCVRAEFTDNANGTQDELCCTLEDREHRWQGAWFPSKGERVAAAIVCEDWDRAGQTRRLDCGLFEIGEIDLSGPPDMVEIRAVSARITRTARCQKKSKPWEEIDLKAIAEHVASRAGLGLVFDATSPLYKREDQREESDLAFLQRLTKEAGGAIKAAEGKLIVYSGAKYDAQGPNIIIKRGEAWIKNYQFTTSSHDIYRGAVLTYWHPEQKEFIVGEFYAPEAPESGELLRLNVPAEDVAEAVAKCKGELRGKNREEVKGSIVLMGDTKRRAMQIVKIAGFGKFDANYFVDTAKHLIDSSGGYTTTLQIRQKIGY